MVDQAAARLARKNGCTHRDRIAAGLTRGGNFGVATLVEFRLHSVGSEVLVFYPFA